MDFTVFCDPGRGAPQHSHKQPHHPTSHNHVESLDVHHLTSHNHVESMNHIDAPIYGLHCSNLSCPAACVTMRLMAADPSRGMMNNQPTEVLPPEVIEAFPQGRLTRESLRRADVVSAFHMAFQMIGGVPRLALWADSNPAEFYKLYGRLLPSSASDEMNTVGKIYIVHALPPPAPPAHPSTPADPSTPDG